MILDIATDDICKGCSRVVRIAFLSRHPTVSRMAQRTIECTSCGHSSVVDLPLGPERPKDIFESGNA